MSNKTTVRWRKRSEYFVQYIMVAFTIFRIGFMLEIPQRCTIGEQQISILPKTLDPQMVRTNTASTAHLL